MEKNYLSAIFENFMVMDANLVITKNPILACWACPQRGKNSTFFRQRDSNESRMSRKSRDAPARPNHFYPQIEFMMLGIYLSGIFLYFMYTSKQKISAIFHLWVILHLSATHLSRESRKSRATHPRLPKKKLSKNYIF